MYDIFLNIGECKREHKCTLEYLAEPSKGSKATTY